MARAGAWLPRNWIRRGGGPNRSSCAWAWNLPWRGTCLGAARAPARRDQSHRPGRPRWWCAAGPDGSAGGYFVLRSTVLVSPRVDWISTVLTCVAGPGFSLSDQAPRVSTGAVPSLTLAPLVMFQMTTEVAGVGTP